MSRFYVPHDAIRGREILVSGQEAHHITGVMRLEKFDKVVTFDGTGKEYAGFIKDVRTGSLIIEIVEERVPAINEKIRISLIQAIPKREKMDYVVEKATELGVDVIVPVLTKRTIPKWDESKRGLQAERWRKIAREASKQCGRADIPEIEEIAVFSKWVKMRVVKYDLALIAALSDETRCLKDVLKDFCGDRVAVAVGPEGDFTEDEIGSAKDAGFKPVDLGPRVLKSDTAALAVLAIVKYEYSN